MFQFMFNGMPFQPFQPIHTVAASDSKTPPQRYQASKDEVIQDAEFEEIKQSSLS